LVIKKGLSDKATFLKKSIRHKFKDFKF